MCGILTGASAQERGPTAEVLKRCPAPPGQPQTDATRIHALLHFNVIW